MALLFKHATPLFGVWKIEESSEELLAMLEYKAMYQPFLEKITTEKRRQEHLTSRILLKELLGKETLVSYHPSGAPFLPNEALSISISHTKEYVAVILDKEPTGIDIEYNSNRVLKIRSRFMNKEEEAGIDPRHETEHLLIHWCAKETLFKVAGQENVDFLKHLHVKSFPYANQGIFSGYETRTPYQKEYKIGFLVTPEYILTYILFLPNLPSSESL